MTIKALVYQLRVSKYFARGVTYCDDYVCFSLHSHSWRTTRLNFANFLGTLPIAVAQSSSGSIVIHYVLLVSWMTSCKCMMGLCCFMCIP